MDLINAMNIDLYGKTVEVDNYFPSSIDDYGSAHIEKTVRLEGCSRDSKYVNSLVKKPVFVCLDRRVIDLARVHMSTLFSEHLEPISVESADGTIRGQMSQLVIYGVDWGNTERDVRITSINSSSIQEKTRSSDRDTIAMLEEGLAYEDKFD